MERDKYGRFAKNPVPSPRIQKQISRLLLTCFILAAIVTPICFYSGYDKGFAAGKEDGYQEGIADHQDAVFKDGFQNGLELGKNWTVLGTSYVSGWTYYQEKSNPDHVTFIDENFKRVLNMSLLNITKVNQYAKDRFSAGCP